MLEQTEKAQWKVKDINSFNDELDEIEEEIKRLERERLEKVK